MRPIAEATGRITSKSFSRKYIALGRVVKNWPEIVGESLADKAQPVKISYRKKEKQKKPEATLHIAVNPSVATVLHYQKDLILERINQVFGEKWITSIRFVAAEANKNEFLKVDKKNVLLNADEKNILSGLLKDVEDDEVKQRLNSLGSAVIMAEKEEEE